jgi:competence protein ComEC
MHQKFALLLLRWRDGATEMLALVLEAERGRFMPFLPVFMAAGVVLYFSLSFEPPVWPAVVVLCLALAANWWLRGIPLLVAALAMPAAMALGFAAAQVQTWRAAEPLEVPSRASFVSGIVVALEALPLGRRVTLAAARFDAGPVLERTVRVRLRATDVQPFETGDHIKVRALLQRPSAPAYPGGWDLQRDAFFNGQGAFGYALNPAERLSAASPGSGAWLQILRERIAARVSAVLPGAAGAVAATLLTGSTAAIPEEDRAAFRDSGLAHLLAIAGLHIGIVMGTLFVSVRLLLVLNEHVALHWPTKQIAALVALLAGGGYLLLTGAHVPIQRSFAMACLVTLGVIVGRRALSLRGLAIAMGAVILVAPDVVMGVSFQMSFSAVLALIVGYAALRPWLAGMHGDGSWRRRVGSHVVALALTSALAGTFSAPYGAYHFGHVQLYYVFANMVAVPLTAFWTLPLGMAALALMPLHLESLALVPMGWGVMAILAVGRFVSAWPQAVVVVPHITTWGLAVFSVGLAWAGLWRSRLRLAGWAAVALGLASPLLASPPDVLVSGDARLIGLFADGALAVQKGSGASRFTLDAWLQVLAVPDAVGLPDGERGRVACDGALCQLDAPNGGGPAVLVRGAAPPGACNAAIVIDAEPLRLECPRAVPVIDRFTVWRDGAHAVWLQPGGALVVSDRGFRGQRPWVAQRPTASRLPPGRALPVAAIDE